MPGLLWLPTPLQPSTPTWELLSTGTMSKWQIMEFVLLLYIMLGTKVDHAVYHPSLSQYLVADIPGIIHGVHLNRGLGIFFLRHVGRCPFLLFVLHLSSPEPWTQLQHLRFELNQYEPDSPTGPTLSLPTKWTCLGLGGKWTPSGATWPKG